MKCSQVRRDSLSRISRISYRWLPLPKLRQPLPLMNNVSIDFTLSRRGPSCGKLLPKRMSSTGGVHRDTDGYAEQPELMVSASRRWDGHEAQLSVCVSVETVKNFWDRSSFKIRGMTHLLSRETAECSFLTLSSDTFPPAHFAPRPSQNCQ